MAADRRKIQRLEEELAELETKSKKLERENKRLERDMKEMQETIDSGAAVRLHIYSSSLFFFSSFILLYFHRKMELNRGQGVRKEEMRAKIVAETVDHKSLEKKVTVLHIFRSSRPFHRTDRMTDIIVFILLYSFKYYKHPLSMESIFSVRRNEILMNTDL